MIQRRKWLESVRKASCGEEGGEGGGGGGGGSGFTHAAWFAATYSMDRFMPHDPEA